MPQEISGGLLTLLTQKQADTASAAHLSQLYWTQVPIINYRAGSIKMFGKKNLKKILPNIPFENFGRRSNRWIVGSNPIDDRFI